MKVNKNINNLTIHIPKYVGKYCLGGEMGICIMFNKKPNIIHRYFMKLLLGWEWFNIKENI